MLTTASGDWTIWMVIAGPILLGVAIAWALMRNRKLTPRENEADELGAARRIQEQDVIDKQRNHGKEI